MIIAGVDPGIDGAIAFLDCTIESKPKLLDVVDMPTAMTGTTKKRKHVMASQLASVFKDYDCIEEVWVEHVHSMPKQGVASSFNFGRSLGVIEGVVAALGIRIQYVTPASWKKHQSLTGKDKDAARTLASELYPDAQLHLKKHVGRADALLIADYGEAHL